MNFKRRTRVNTFDFGSDISSCPHNPTHKHISIIYYSLFPTRSLSPITTPPSFPPSLLGCGERALKMRHRCVQPNPSTSEIEFKTIPVDSINQSLILKLYRLVVKIRPLYLAAGERWNRRDKLDEMKNTEGLVYKIAYAGTEILGFISYVLDQQIDAVDDPVTFVWELHVASSAKRRGIGKTLIKQITQETDNSLLLRTFQCNRNAVAFYNSIGFQVNHDLSDHVSLMMGTAR